MVVFLVISCSYVTFSYLRSDVFLSRALQWFLVGFDFWLHSEKPEFSAQKGEKTA